MYWTYLPSLSTLNASLWGNLNLSEQDFEAFANAFKKILLSSYCPNRPTFYSINLVIVTKSNLKNTQVVSKSADTLVQVQRTLTLRGRVSLYRWPPVELVWVWPNKKNCCSFNISKAAESKQNKQEVSCTVILPLMLVFSAHCKTFEVVLL